MRLDQINAAKRTIGIIVSQLCEKHGVTRAELLGRDLSFSFVRNQLYYEAYHRTDLGSTTIAKLLKKSPHPVKHGITRHKARLEKAQSGEHKEAGE